MPPPGRLWAHLVCQVPATVGHAPRGAPPLSGRLCRAVGWTGRSPARIATACGTQSSGQSFCTRARAGGRQRQRLPGGRRGRPHPGAHARRRARRDGRRGPQRHAPGAARVRAPACGAPRMHQRCRKHLCSKNHVRSAHRRELCRQRASCPGFACQGACLSPRVCCRCARWTPTGTRASALTSSCASWRRCCRTRRRSAGSAACSQRTCEGQVRGRRRSI